MRIWVVGTHYIVHLLLQRHSKGVHFCLRFFILLISLHFVNYTYPMSDQFWNIIIQCGIHGYYKTLEVLKGFSALFHQSFFKRVKLPIKSYADRLLHLGFHSLEYRRVFLDLLMCFEIVKNLVDLDASAFFHINLSPYGTIN